MNQRRWTIESLDLKQFSMLMRSCMYKQDQDTVQSHLHHFKAENHSLENLTPYAALQRDFLHVFMQPCRQPKVQRMKNTIKCLFPPLKPSLIGENANNFENCISESGETGVILTVFKYMVEI